MEFRFGGLTFTSKFDSGNLANVEKVSKEDEESDQTGQSVPPSVISPGVEMKPDFEFNVWTKPDCAGTSYANGNRSWFYFGVRGGSFGKVIKINIMNMNRQGRLYSQGHVPLVRTLPGRPKWERIRDKPGFETINNNFVLSFSHRFFDSRASITYFAFSYPWSYETCQDRLKELDEKFNSANELNSNSIKTNIYYHRELLCHSLEGRRVDLITISDCNGIQDAEEPRFDKNLFPDLDSKRCKSFVGKKVYVVSSRVHPGETPSSFVFNGFLDFILREDDLRAKQLRKQYVFKLIPMLNPDGVSQGHYRTDTRGVNLNRVYLDPTFELYPSIYGAKSLLVYHHIWNSDLAVEEKEFIAASVRSDSSAAKSVNTEEGPLSSRVAPSDVAVSNTTRNFVFGGNAGELTNELESHRPTSMFDFEGYRVTRSVDLEASGASFPLIASPPTVQCETMQRNSDLEMPSDSSISTAAVGSATLNILSSIRSSCLLNTDNLQGNCSVADGSMDCSACPTEAFAVEKTEVHTKNVVEFIPKQNSLPSSADLNDLPSGGECEDFEDDFQRGNEGSDDEGNDKTPIISDVVNTRHLSHPSLLSIPPHSSGIAFYVDLHGHAAKRGCFIYGNYFEDEETQIESMLFVKLLSLNSAHFDFGACNFTEKNMYMVDKKDGSSKEGSGRVAAFKALGIIHSYTLECNYNTGRLVNAISQALGSDGRVTPPPLAGFPPKYTPAHYEEVGRAMAIAAIDLTETNPWSRVPSSDYFSVFGLREHMRRHLQSLRAPAKSLLSRTGRTGARGLSQAAGALPRVALLAKHSTIHSSQVQNNENNINASCNGSSAVSNTTSTTDAKKFSSVTKKPDLSSVKDVGPRLTGTGLQRQRPFSHASGPSTTSVPSARCSQPPSSSQLPSRRPARCAVMSLVPLSSPIDSWTSSSAEFQLRRQNSGALPSKTGSASSTSTRARHFQSLFAQHSRTSKSLNSDVMPAPDSSLDLSAMHKSVTHALFAGITPETPTQICLGPVLASSVEASIYHWPSHSKAGLQRQVTEGSSPSLGRGPPMGAKKGDMEPDVLSSLSLADETTSTSLLSFGTKQSTEDGKKRSSIPVFRTSFSKKTESNAKITAHLLSSASTGSQLSSLSNTINPENNSEICRSKAVKGNKPTSCHDKTFHLMGSHLSPTGTKKVKRKKKSSIDRRT